MPSATHADTSPQVPEVPNEELRTRPGRIVVGVDGSSGADAALSWAAAQAREHGLVLDIVAAWEDIADENSPDSRQQAARTRVERALETLGRRRLLPGEVITAPLHGPTGEQLIARAHGAGMLVLGTTGIGSPREPHSLGLYCLRHTPIPLIFVPPEPSQQHAVDTRHGGSDPDVGTTGRDASTT
jgi:nucleotide-binding universal stress UspA family protein